MGIPEGSISLFLGQIAREQSVFKPKFTSLRRSDNYGICASYKENNFNYSVLLSEEPLPPPLSSDYRVRPYVNLINLSIMP